MSIETTNYSNMQRFLTTALCVFLAMTTSAQNNNGTSNRHGDFGHAQWIGHMTRQQANIPDGRNFTGAKLKEPAFKAAWTAVDSLSSKSIYLQKDVKIKRGLKAATIHIAGLGFYELTINT